MRNSPSANRIPVEAKVIDGWSAASKKSADRMWLSRISWCVSMELASIVAVTVDSSGFCAVVNSAVKEVNRPRTLLTIMCLMVKPT